MFVIVLFFIFIAIASWLAVTEFNRPPFDTKPLETFALENDLHFEKPGPISLVPPLISQEGEEYTIPATVSGRLETYQFQFFPCQYKVYQTNHFSNMKTLWVLKVEIDHPLPEFVLDSLYNNDVIKKLFKDYETVKLEGDFNNYYKLYVPRKRETAVLSVLSPDVMERIAKDGMISDILVAGRKIWFISSFEKQHESIILDMLGVSEAVIPELLHRARTYHEEDAL